MSAKYSIVWDLETTGFVAPAAKILEIGCYIVRGDEVEKKHWVLNNDVEIPERITEITGIDQAIIDAEGRDPKECLDEFLPLFKNCEANITHNGVKFDINFLVNYAADVLDWDTNQKESVRQLIKLTAYDTAVYFKAKKLDMSQMDREHFINFADRVMEVRAYGVKFNLGLCCEEVGIPLDVEQHRAMADVELTHRIYKHINSDAVS
jgi:DNA polymerase III epsilon subunit-like protein